MAFDYVATMKAMNSETSEFTETLKSIRTNQGFIAFRKFISGTWLWAPMNKMMGVLNLYQQFANAQTKQNKAMVQNIENFSKLRDSVKELNFLTPIAGYSNLIDVAGKYEEVTNNIRGQYKSGGLFSGRKGLGLSTQDVGQMQAEAQANMPMYQQLIDLGYNPQEALEKVMEALKPLAKQNEKIKKTMDRELEIQRQNIPIYKSWLKLKHKWEDFVGADWIGFTKFIGKGLMMLMVLPLIAMVLWKVFRGTTESFKWAKDYFSNLFTFIMEGFTAISDRATLIYDALMKDGSIWDLIDGLLLVFEGFIRIIGGILIGVIGGLLVWLGASIIESLQNLSSRLKENNITGAAYWLKMSSALVGILAALAALVFIWTGAGIVYIFAAAIISAITTVLGFKSSGGPASGLTVVGENGPELLNLPGGSHVYSNRQSKSMVGGGNNIHVHVNGRVGASDAEIRDIANKVAQQINVRMNRTSSTGTGF